MKKLLKGCFDAQTIFYFCSAHPQIILLEIPLSLLLHPNPKCQNQGTFGDLTSKHCFNTLIFHKGQEGRIRVGHNLWKTNQPNFFFLFPYFVNCCPLPAKWNKIVLESNYLAFVSSRRKFSIVVAAKRQFMRAVAITVAFFWLFSSATVAGPSWEIVDYVPLLLLLSFL